MLGEKYKWVNLRYAKKDQGIISKLGYNERFFANRPFKFTELSRFMEKLIVYYENNGYPFVTAKLDSLEFDKSQCKSSCKN
jgi:translocation and assembly module TamA